MNCIERLQGSPALVPPEVATLHQFLQKRFTLLDGPRLIDETSRLVLLEGLVKEELERNRLFNRNPKLLAPSISSVLAKMIEQLAAAGVLPEALSAAIRRTEFFDKKQVQLLLDVYREYEKTLHDLQLTDPAGMLSYLLDRFDPACFRGYRAVIIDGIHGADRLEAEIVRKIIVSADCTCLVDAPSAALVKDAGEFHPLTVVREFLLSIGSAPEQARVPASSNDMFLASALFSDRPFADEAEKAPAPSSFSKSISLLSAVNTREEVSLIAREVKKSLRNDVAADSILVAFPALDEYASLVQEIFNDYGIPYNRALGRQLGTSPVATAVISLLRCCQEDFSGLSLLRVFNSPFLKFSEKPEIGQAFDRIMRSRRIIGGKQKVLSALKYDSTDEGGKDVLTEPIKDLFAALEPFCRQETAALTQWMERLSVLIEWSEAGRRAGLIKGPLNTNLQAYKKLKETLASLAQAGTTFPGYRYSFGEWLFLLKKTFMHTRFQVPPEDESGVQILGLEESQGRPWNEIYLGGLVEGKFPQRLPQNIFLPEQTLEAMGVRTLERSRLNAAYHFYRLLLSADKMMLTYPENEGDRPMVPSPFLEELSPIIKTGLANRGIERTSGIQFGLKIEESRSIPEFAKAISISLTEENRRALLASIEGVKELPDGNRELISRIEAIRSVIETGRPEAARPAVPVIKHEFSVTELDAYLNCPYDYYVARVLRIEPLEEVTEDISPLDRGSKVHGILRNFYLAWHGPIAKDNVREAAELLRKLADSAFDMEADTFRNRREKDLFLTVMAARFLAAEEMFWKQGLRPAHLERKIERYPLVLSDGREVRLTAKIDRIDLDENANFIIVDYKTGRYPLPKMNTEQEIFQLPIYAAMAHQALSNAGADDTTPLRNPIGLAYYDLMGKTGAGARDVVLFDREARADHPSSKPRASAKTSAEFETILKQSMDKARKAVEGILAGNFPPAPGDENKCRYCANEVMCGKIRNE